VEGVLCASKNLLKKLYYFLENTQSTPTAEDNYEYSDVLES
jgi:hypothetical protein